MNVLLFRSCKWQMLLEIRNPRNWRLKRTAVKNTDTCSVLYLQVTFQGAVQWRSLVVSKDIHNGLLTLAHSGSLRGLYVAYMRLQCNVHCIPRVMGSSSVNRTVIQITCFSGTTVLRSINLSQKPIPDSSFFFYIWLWQLVGWQSWWRWTVLKQFVEEFVDFTTWKHS